MTEDLTKTLDGYQARVGEIRLVEVPETAYLMADGEGDPNTSPRFAEAVAALYPVAYALRALSARELDRPFVVPPLEGLWWSADMAAFTARRDQARWSWTLLLAVPPWLGAADALRAIEGKGSAGVRLGTLAEGLCLQTLHVGSFDDEGPVLARLHEQVRGAGLVLTGHHHEVYLSDPRRTPPERRRTILRQPVRPA